MTRSEREQLREAVRLLCPDDDGRDQYNRGMDILMHLLGVKETQHERLQKSLKEASISEIIQFPTPRQGGGNG